MPRINYYEVIEVENAKTFQDESFQKIITRKYNKINDQRVYYFNLRPTFFLWENFDNGLPKIMIGDIIEEDRPEPEEPEEDE